jgi:hypothetical protein
VEVDEVHEPIHLLEDKMQSAKVHSQEMEASLKEITGILMNNRGQPKKPSSTETSSSTQSSGPKEDSSSHAALPKYIKMDFPQCSGDDPSV